MSWAHISASSSGAQAASGGLTSLSCSYAANITGGNFLVSSMTGYGAGSVSVSGGGGGSWAAATSATNNGSNFAVIGYSVSTTSEAVTVTWSSTTSVSIDPSVSVDEYSGGGSATVDGTVNCTSLATSGNMSIGPVTVTGTDLVYGVVGCYSTPSMTAGTGFTMRYVGGATSGKTVSINAEDEVNATTNTTVAWVSGSQSWFAAAASFTTAAAAPAWFPETPFPSIPPALLAI